jgi:hypothetical protein
MEIYNLRGPFFLRVLETASTHESEGSPEENEKVSSGERRTILKTGGPDLKAGP